MWIRIRKLTLFRLWAHTLFGKWVPIHPEHLVFFIIKYRLYAIVVKFIVFCTSHLWWAQVEWWLEHRHGWLIKHKRAGSLLGWVTRNEYQVLGSTSIPARLDTLIYWESFSWLTSVGTTRNTVIWLGWSRIALAVLIQCVHGLNPTYLNDLFTEPLANYNFRDKCRLHQPQFHTYTYGFRSFKYSGLKLWNSLSRAIKNTNDINEF